MSRLSFLEGALRRHDLLAAGIASGLLAGFVMALSLALCAAVNGMEPLGPLKLIGATIARRGVLGGEAGAATAGALVHLATSVAYGVLFAALFPKTLPLGCAAVVGAGYAFFVLGVMMSCVVPAVSLTFRGEAQPLGGSWVIAHALFGAVLSLAPALRRKLASPARGDARGLATTGPGAREIVPDQRAATRAT